MLTYAYCWMSNLMASLKKEEGQGMTEYALILVLIAIAAIVVMGLLGDEIDNTFNDVITGLKTR